MNVQLEVFADTNGVLIPLDTIVGQQHAVQTDPWLSKSVTIAGLADMSVQIVFVGTRGSSFTGDIAIDDVRLFVPSPIDGGVTDIIGLASGCGLGTDTVEIEITNFGTNALTSVPVEYTVNGGAPVQETFNGNIAAGAKAYYAFTTTVNLSASGTYNIVARTNLTGDGDATNDDDNITVDNIPTVNPSTTFYNENFEGGSGGWIGTGSWQRGTPSGTFINTPGQGSNSWVTELTGNYPNGAADFLYSPCLDLTNATNPAIEFQLIYNTETSWDGGVLQATTDGVTWTTIGNNGATVNWYNTTGNFSMNTYHPTGDGWEGSSAGGVTAAHDLFGLAGQSSVQLRFVFGSDGSVNNFDGMGIDSVWIYDNINVGIEDQVVEETTFSVSPNPSNGLFNLDVSSEQYEQMQLTVRDIDGKLVYNERVTVNGRLNKSMDLSHLAKGVYYLRLQNDTESKVEKLIIL